MCQDSVCFSSLPNFMISFNTCSAHVTQKYLWSSKRFQKDFFFCSPRQIVVKDRSVPNLHSASTGHSVAAVVNSIWISLHKNGERRPVLLIHLSVSEVYSIISIDYAHSKLVTFYMLAICSELLSAMFSTLDITVSPMLPLSMEGRNNTSDLSSGLRTARTQRM